MEPLTTSPYDFGQTLRRLRNERRITGKDLADRTGFSQPKISKIENGKVLPTTDDLEVIADALDLGSIARADLLDALEQLQTDLTSIRLMQRRGIHWTQDDIRHLESTTTTFRTFQTLALPGLLQTAEYARSVFRLLGTTDKSALARAVASKVERQEVLYDDSKQFLFLLSEGALRTRYLDARGHRIQLAALRNLTTLPNVEVAVLPFSAQLNAVPSNDFTIYDENMVTVETLTSHLKIRGEKEIQIYANVHRSLWEAAIAQGATEDLLQQLEDEQQLAVTASQRTR